jgi:outer membrane receptor protein involved in Fe transport
MKETLRFKPLSLAVAVALLQIGNVLAENVAKNVEEKATQTLPAVQVIGTTPLEGIGLPIDKVSADVKVVESEQMREQGALTLADYMNGNMTGVSVVETQGNPFQPDVRFHGFSASSLLGSPQGLSVYVDGVRVNEPFGDVVSWDLIQMNAVKQMQLMPGTNPVFGLNSIGGAISLETKRGRNATGGAVEFSGGSWGRKNTQFEYGGVTKDGHDYFFAANYFDEKGWRDASPTTVGQIFGQIGWQDSITDLSLTIALASNDLIGNGLVPVDMMNNSGRNTVYTKPDQTKNRMAFFNLKASRMLADDKMLSGNVYYRDVTTNTLNGDLNGDVEEQGSPAAVNNWVAACQAGAGINISNGKSHPSLISGGAETFCNAVLNTSKTTKKGFGGSAQWTSTQLLSGRDNQLTAGIAYNRSKIKFEQDAQYGYLNSDRGVIAVPFFSEDSTSMNGTTNSYSLFGTNTHSFNDRLSLNTSARFDYTTIANVDNLVPSGTGSLTGDHVFHRLNPSVGLNFKVANDLTTYIAYNEGSRAPTSMELGCADPAAPCKLPNSMAGDPPLKQVVTRSFDLGARGKFNNGMGWSFSAYRAENSDDIQFIRNGTSGSALGYFSNVGTTLRQGFDAAVFGSQNRWSWNASLSVIRATYESSFQGYVGDNKDKSKVAPGDRIPEIPNLQIKLRAAYQATPEWKVGSNLVGFSSVYLQGNENNGYFPASGYFGNGKAAGYTVLHLDTQYRPSQGNWQLFAKVNNVFNRGYNTGGLQGASMFNQTTNAYAGDDYRTSLFAPGAPRGIWVGIRYDFDRKKSSASVDTD